MTTKEEEENEIIKNEMAEGLILIYKDTKTTTKLKQKIEEELFDRLVRLESIEQVIINNRRYYEKWLNDRGYFGKWDTINDLTTDNDNAYSFGIASGIYKICTALLL